MGFSCDGGQSHLLIFAPSNHRDNSSATSSTEQEREDLFVGSGSPSLLLLRPPGAGKDNRKGCGVFFFPFPCWKRLRNAQKKEKTKGISALKKTTEQLNEVMPAQTVEGRRLQSSW